MPYLIKECKKKQVAKMARVNTLRKKLKIVDQSQRSGGIPSKTKHGNG